MNKKILYVQLIAMLLFGHSIPAKNTENNFTFNGKLIYDSKKSSETELRIRKNLSILNKEFQEYSIYNLSSEKISTAINGRSSEKSITLKLGEEHLWNLKLQRVELRTGDYQLVENTNQGKIFHKRNPSFTYQGVNHNSAIENNIVALTIHPNYFTGYIENGEKRYYIQPLSDFTGDLADNEIVLYDVTKISSNSKTIAYCGSKHDKIYEESFNSNELMATKCAELAVATDQSFLKLHGSAEKVEEVVLSRLNFVSTFYQDKFEIGYSLKRLYISKNNEITPDSKTASIPILDDFKAWANNGGFGTTKDAASFWTDRNICDGSNCGNIGYSKFAGICNTNGYNINEDWTSSAYGLGILWAHEFGHTWNAYHGSTNKTYLMSPTVYQSSGSNGQVTDKTKNSVLGHKNSRDCLSNGPCDIHTGNSTVQTLTSNIKIFPTPAQDLVNIRIKDLEGKNTSIEIISLDGKTLFVRSFSPTNNYQTETINLGKFDKGTYIIKISSNNKITTSKLIVVN